MIFWAKYGLVFGRFRWLPDISYRTPENLQIVRRTFIFQHSRVILAEGLKSTLPKEHDWVRTILTCAEEILCLLEDISDLSCMEAGGFKIEFRPFAIRPVVEEVRDLFSLQARQKSIVLEASIAPDVPETLVGDARRLRQVLLNLTGNALKFTETGYVSIAVSSESPLLFCVKDSGTGMPAEMLEAIFTPFTSCHKNGGRGLGLAISKRLVELMGGFCAWKPAPDSVPASFSGCRCNRCWKTELPDCREKRLSAANQPHQQ